MLKFALAMVKKCYEKQYFVLNTSDYFSLTSIYYFRMEVLNKIWIKICMKAGIADLSL